jgi:uncharacterized damage-inducible protein DinB
METNSIEATIENTTLPITLEQLHGHWQGHRALSRRVLEAFPENDLYTFSIGGMRTFAELTMEMIDLAAPGVKGIVTGDWSGYGEFGTKHTDAPDTKAGLLAIWDKVTEEIDKYWPQLQADRLQERDMAFGMYEGPVYGTFLDLVDNEIHHRAQGYVYLRALGVEPPAFWDRA